MDSFTTDIDEKEQSKALRTYHGEKDVNAVLKQVAGNVYSDFKEKYNRSMYSHWGLPEKNLEFCSVKLHGDKIVFQVYETFGGRRTPMADVQELEERAKDTKKLLQEFVKEVKKEFKTRTGKALKVSKPKTVIDWERVALNGLYRFVGIQSGEFSCAVEPQKYPENIKDAQKEALE